MASSSNQSDERPRGVRPPDYIPPWHRSADLGYPDFLPPRPGQEEDSMAEPYIKTGYVGKPLVATDSFTVHDMIHETWEKNNQFVLNQLGELMSEVFVRRNRMLPGVASSSYKVPERRTPNEQRKAAWIADLANPDVPLSKLAAAVPGGPKGHDYFDLLEQNRVPIPRAVWYARILGYADMGGNGKRPSIVDPTNFTLDWTNLITSYLKKQLGDIVLPRAAASQSSAIKSVFKSVLTEPSLRERWINKFSYSLALLREFYAESLVDHATFLIWLAHQVSAANLAQLGFVAKLSDEYLEGLLQHRGFLRPFIEGCTLKITEIGKSPGKDELNPLLASLASLLQRAFVAYPDSFVYPTIWMDHEGLLRALFVSEPHLAVPALQRTDLRTKDLLRLMAENFEDIQKRNDAALLRNLPERSTLSVSRTMADIQILNNLTGSTDINAIRYLENADGSLIDQSSKVFESRLNILLTWSVVPLQFGDHRPYVACTILSKWKEEAKIRSIRRRTSANNDLQERLFDWLKNEQVARDHAQNLRAVTRLYGELSKKKLFSFEAFVRRLMAIGEIGSSRKEAPRSYLMSVLYGLPLDSESLNIQRKAALYGTTDPKTDPEAGIFETLCNHLVNVLPELFQAQQDDSPPLLHVALAPLLEATRYEQSRCTSWLWKIMKDRLKQAETGLGVPGISLDLYHKIVEIFRMTKDYPLILEMNLQLLDRITNVDLIRPILGSLWRHGDVWAAMNALPDIGEKLVVTYYRLGSSKSCARQLLLLLNKPEYRDRLVMEDREKLKADTQAYLQGLYPTNNDRAPSLPTKISDILTLSSNEDPMAPLRTARKIWSKYHHFPRWGGMVWDNVFHAICQLTTSVDDPSVWLLGAARYAAMLEEIASLLSFEQDLDYLVTQWLISGAGYQKFIEMEAHCWMAMLPFLLHLVLHGVLSTSTIMKGLVYKAWARAAVASEEVEPIEVLLEACNVLARRLLLIDDLGPSDYPTIPPSTIGQIQAMQTHRRRVYSGLDVTKLFNVLPKLVEIELNQELRQDLRIVTTKLRVDLCKHVEFRAIACRHMEVLRENFLQIASSPQGKELELRLADALRLIVNGEAASHPGVIPALHWESLSTSMNEWEFPKATIELHLSLKHIRSQMENPDTKQEAEAELQQFMNSFFGQSMRQEDVDLLADVLCGINGVIAGKFLNLGMESLSTYLKGLPSPLREDSMLPFLQSTSETLRLLALVLVPRPAESEAPSLKNPPPPPSLEQASIDGFMSALIKVVTDTENALKVPKTIDAFSIDPKLSDMVILLCRMLQFCLRFEGVWTLNNRGSAENLIAMLLRLSLVFGGNVVTTPAIFRLLIDTASYLMDVLPKDPDNTRVDIDRQIPGIQPTCLPLGMPLELSNLLRPLLKYVPQDAYVHDLVHISMDQPAEANTELGPPVQARPWEWSEYTDSPQRNEQMDEGDGEIKNDTSISLEYFMARPTGESLIGSTENAVGWESRFFQDHLHQETMHTREWRDSTIALSPVDESAGGSDTEEDEEHVEAHFGRDMTGVSPASMQHTTSSGRSGDREIIDVDALPEMAGSSRGRKRKSAQNSSGQTTMEVIDDDIQIIEVISGKRGRGRPPGSKTKKK